MSLLQEKIFKLKDNSKEGVKDLSKKEFQTYSEIFNSSEFYSGKLASNQQDVISVILPNSIEYLEVLVACIMTGNIFNPIPFFTSDEELERIFKYIKPKKIITTRDLNFSSPPKLKLLNPSEVKRKSNKKKFEKDPIDGGKIASLYYSSGTTGNPKGVLYSHDNVFFLIESINRGFGFSKETKHLSFLPFGHTASINYNIFPSLFNGSSLVIAEGFSSIANNFFKILSQESIAYTQAVPTVIYMLLKINYQLQNLDFSSLMFIGCGSSILPVESQKQFQEKFDIKIGNLYGLSETGPTHIDDPRKPDWQPGSIGVPLDVNECKISEDSEILIKGKNVFSGYFKNEKLFNEVVKAGWFYTGDLGIYQDKKFIYKDRSKDLIIKGGINIVPAEVEEILYKNKEILEAAVVGVFDKVHGEEVIAGVALKNLNTDKELIKTKLYKLLSDNLSSYKHPIDIFFLESLPKTHSGKLKRREVKKIIENEYNKRI